MDDYHSEQTEILHDLPRSLGSSGSSFRSAPRVTLNLDNSFCASDNSWRSPTIRFGRPSLVGTGVRRLRGRPGALRPLLARSDCCWLAPNIFSRLRREKMSSAHQQQSPLTSSGLRLPGGPLRRLPPVPTRSGLSPRIVSVAPRIV